MRRCVALTPTDYLPATTYRCWCFAVQNPGVGRWCSTVDSSESLLPRLDIPPFLLPLKARRYVTDGLDHPRV